MRSTPPLVKNLIFINLLFWLATLLLPRFSPYDLVTHWGLHYWESQAFSPVQFISYLFLHDPSSFAHVFFNMFGLWMFGKDLEAMWGSSRFLLFYLVSGIGAGFIQELTWMISYHPIAAAFDSVAAGGDVMQLSHYLTNITPGAAISPSQLFHFKELMLSRPVTIGASGSLFGILLAFAVVFPQARMMLIFLPVPIRAPYFVAIYALCELFLGVQSFSGDSVAHFAHLGGMIFAGILLYIWKKQGKLYQ